ncbi:MAG: CDP-alcohol phosphatidyltransferase family protein [Spirochaetaceae bacterium]|nr:MAG: CDP-alcohol phosphatidyltransferase family protein [Spirochaetaceae bacterium]
MSFRSDILKVPNLLSLSRIVLAPAAFYLFQIPGMEGKLICIVFLGMLFLTDLFDGILARKLDQKSELGRILDPLGDKVLVAVLFIALIFYRGVPWWLVAIILVRDLVILVAGLYIKKTRNMIIESNIWGKLSTTFLMLTVILLIIEDFPYITWGLFAAGLLFLLISSITYLVIFIKTVSPASSRLKKPQRS